MLKQFVNDFTLFLMQYFPYIVAIKIKDSVTMLAGFFIGIVFSVFWLSYTLKNAHIEWKDFSEDNIVAVAFHNGKKVITYVSNPQSFTGWFNIILALGLLRRKRNDTITLKDIKKVRRIMLVLIILAIVLTVFGLMFILTPEVPIGTDSMPHPQLEQ